MRGAKRMLLVVCVLQLAMGGRVSATRVVADDSASFSGYVIALAWPKAWAKEAGDGYDNFLRGLGINDGGFYRVGHAALVLVNGADGSCHYFDFGRYHTPVGMGRVRDASTDHGLTLSTMAVADGKELLNLDAILCEVHSNPSTHASGPLYASYVRIDFQRAYAMAKEVQMQGMLPYGPFEMDGSNCSRFVRQIILAGAPHWAHALRLSVVPMITPTTLYPFSALYHWTKVPGCLDLDAEATKEQLSALPDSLFRNVIPEPERPATVPITAQWLAGESAGSWFALVPHEHGVVMTRYSASGIQECSVVLSETSRTAWNGLDPYTLTYPSHCERVTVVVNGETVVLTTRSD